MTYEQRIQQMATELAKTAFYLGLGKIAVAAQAEAIREHLKSFTHVPSQIRDMEEYLTENGYIPAPEAKACGHDTDQMATCKDGSVICVECWINSPENEQK